MRLTRRGGVVLVLGTTQTVAWASSYYLAAMAHPVGAVICLTFSRG